MNFYEQTYLNGLQTIIDDGVEVVDRTGVGTRMVTNLVIEHGDVSRYFPVPVTKKLAMNSVVGELLWFLEGSTSDRRLAEITYNDGDHKTIWTANWESKPYRSPTTSKQQAEDFNGPRLLGPVYGKQWREFGPPNRSSAGDVSKSVDQLRDVVTRIKTNPFDRRLVVSAWNPQQIGQMSLPPCHMIYQFNVIGDRLDLLMMQRSGDMFLGIPFNMASYATLLQIVGRETGYRPGKISIIIGNAHIYLNHLTQVREQLSRANTSSYLRAIDSFRTASANSTTPRLDINKDSRLFNEDGTIGMRLSDFYLANYHPLPAIKGDMAV